MSRIEKLYIDSRDRAVYETPSDFTVNLPGDRAIRNSQSIYIDSVVFPNTLYVVSQANNKLYCDMRVYYWGEQGQFDLQTVQSHNYFQVELDIGDYTTSEVSALLPQKIMDSFNTAHPSLPELVGVACTFDNISSRFQVSLPFSPYGGGTTTGFRYYFTIEDKKSTVFPNSFLDSLNYVLGFDSNDHYHISLLPGGANVTPFVRTSTAYPRLSGENYIFLHCSAVSSSETSTKDSSNSDVLFKINLPQYGSISYIELNTGHNNSYVSTNSPEINQLRFYITNSRDDKVSNIDDYSFILGVMY